jgi:hypothetical protein
MKRLTFVAALAAVLAVVAAAPAGARHAVVPAPGTWCGGTLWKLMTLSDATRWTVYPTPIRTSIPAIANLTAPKRITASRTTSFERQVWSLTAVIERYRIQSNGEIALELYDVPSSLYMNAYMPNPRCVTNASHRSEILAARSAFTKDCGKPTAAWQTLGATVRLAGIGFWNPVKTTLGALGNGAELRPVIHFEPLQGCGRFG